MYITLRDVAHVQATQEISEGVMVDLDRNDHIIGIEILSPGREAWPIHKLLELYGPRLTMDEMYGLVKMAERYRSFSYDD